jgi:hypothetical protein
VKYCEDCGHQAHAGFVCDENENCECRAPLVGKAGAPPTAQGRIGDRVTISGPAIPPGLRGTYVTIEAHDQICEQLRNDLLSAVIETKTWKERELAQEKVCESLYADLVIARKRAGFEVRYGREVKIENTPAIPASILEFRQHIPGVWEYRRPKPDEPWTELSAMLWPTLTPAELRAIADLMEKK